MIDNIMLLITGTLHQRQISELRSKFHPFGRFEELESSNIASTPADLYNAILVDTPLGKYTLILQIGSVGGISNYIFYIYSSILQGVCVGAGFG